MFHVVGHTMVGTGYDDSTSDLMYIHDTWDHSSHTMIWGGSYAGMAQTGVTVVILEQSNENGAVPPVPGVNLLLLN